MKKSVHFRILFCMCCGRGRQRRGGGNKEKRFLLFAQSFFLFNFHSFIPFFAHFISHSQNILCFLRLFPQVFCFVLPTSFNKDLRQHTVFFFVLFQEQFLGTFYLFSSIYLFIFRNFFTFKLSITCDFLFRFLFFCFILAIFVFFSLFFYIRLNKPEMEFHSPKWQKNSKVFCLFS